MEIQKNSPDLRIDVSTSGAILTDRTYTEPTIIYNLDLEGKRSAVGTLDEQIIKARESIAIKESQDGFEIGAITVTIFNHEHLTHVLKAKEMAKYGSTEDINLEFIKAMGLSKLFLDI